MGSWNAGLYDSDAAADLRSTLALARPCERAGSGTAGPHPARCLSRVAPELSTLPVSTAIEHDWTICYGALNPTIGKVQLGCELASLLET
ncbi:hypothetical protein LP420_01570 [Massilia sp. B-10]|nr:hypothetical protein LP420_01570 [Massilia sp. B-10]